MTLPQGWVNASIGSLCDLINGKAFKPINWAKEGLPIIRIQNLNRADASFNFCNEAVEPRYVVEPGELLFAWSGTPGTSFGAHVWRGPQAVLNQHIFRIRFDQMIVDRDYFRAAINSMLQELIGKAHGGVGLAHVTKGKFEATTVPLPPICEQRRIVAKLDTLTTRLARARAESSRTSALAKRLRERAVRSAYYGMLVGDIPEPSASCGTPAALPFPIPVGWTWTTLGAISTIKSGVTLGKTRPASQTLIEVPYLRVANVQRGSLDLSVIKTIAVTEPEVRALALESGDILLNEGGDRDKLGRGWVWEGQVSRCIHQNHVFRARLTDTRHSPHYVSLYINEFAQDYFVEHGTQTTNLASVSKAKVAALPIPMAPPDQQQDVVRRVNATFARADRLEAEAARARTLLDRLEAAILARAFRGELVPQDPDDEPASVLLDRIRARRVAAPKAKRGRRPIGQADPA